MTKRFITGDRTPALFYPTLVAVELVRAGRDGVTTIVTGDNGGVEAMVRTVGEMAGFDVQVVETTAVLDNGKPDWDARHGAVKALGVDEVVAIHVEPMASSITKSAMRVFDENELRLVGQPDLVL